MFSYRLQLQNNKVVPKHFIGISVRAARNPCITRAKISFVSTTKLFF